MEKPTILLITADELQKKALSCYGNTIIQTPNLDRLAGTGVRYDRAYCASPWCLPSRCSILTGLFPSHSGAYSNFRKCELSGRFPNLFSVFRENGYRTALSGKCHFAPVPYGQTKPDKTLPYKNFRDYYLSLGLDDLFLQDGKEVSAWFYDDYAAELDKAGLLPAYRAARWARDTGKVYPFPLEDRWYPDIWTANQMTTYIKEYAYQKPAMLWMSFSGPHYPFDAPASYYGRVDEAALAAHPIRRREGELDDPARIHHKSYHGGGNIDGCGPAPGRACKNYDEAYWARLRRSYYANVALIDDMVGQVIAAAEERWEDNLLVIFTADHGEMLGSHGLWGKHNCMYEEVWNVPLLVRYPGKGAAGTCGALVQLTDLFATCMGAAGIEGIPTDGADLRQLAAAGGHPYVFAEGEGYLAVSDGRYKYAHIRKPGERFDELLDLEKDPGEYENAIGREENQPALVDLERQAVTHFMLETLP